MRRPRIGVLARVIGYEFLVLFAVGLAMVAIGRLMIEPPLRASGGRMTTWIATHVTERARDDEQLRVDVARLRESMNMDITIYRLDGTVRASSREPPLPPATDAVRAGLAPGEAIDIGHGLFAFGIADPAGRSIGAANVARAGEASAPSLAGYAIVHEPRPPLSADRGLLVVMAAIGMAALASIPLARSVLRPLARLATATRAFGEGDTTARVQLDRSDEFGDLARAFDEMAARVETLRRTEKELLANVSHELRTPMARIRVVLDLASDGDPAKVHRYLPEIARDLAELERLVDDVLTTARLDLARGRLGGAGVPMHWTETDPGGLIERSAERFRALHAGRALEIERPAGSPLPIVRCDPVLLRRVFDNLLDNAARYSPETEAVTLTARGEHGWLVVEIADRGRGLSAADQARVFEPFYRAEASRDRRSGGVGLGLSLARQIVRAHAGTLELTSVPGHGTRLTVRIPGMDSRAVSPLPGL